jgi:probable phosphoglycerate mutase
MKAERFTIIAIRHGETEWNQIGKAQNQLDSPLTMKGKRQMHNVGRYLATQRPLAINAIYTSQLGRAISSAKTIARYLRVPVISQMELSEFDSEQQRKTMAIQWIQRVARHHNNENPILLLGHGDWIKTLASLGTPKQIIETPNNGEILRIDIEV